MSFIEAIRQHVVFGTKELRRTLRLTENDLFRYDNLVIDEESLSSLPQTEQVTVLALGALSSELVRETTIIEAELLCQTINASNIFLRGSSATGMTPLGDFDLSHYGVTSEYIPEKWPEKLMGIPISWGHIPQDQLPDCLTISLRMMSSMLEAIPLTKTDPEVMAIINRAKHIITHEGKPYYLLYRNFEQCRLDLPWKKNRGNPIDAYHQRKETPGGKRTIQRICWSLQMLYPELMQTPNPDIQLIRALHQKLIPFEVVDSAFRVLRMINSHYFQNDTFYRSTQIIHQWYTEHLTPQIQHSVTNSVPSEYLRVVNAAFNNITDPDHFSEIISYAESLGNGYETWLILWVTSHNVNCPPRLLIELWYRYLGRMAYRNMLRNLLRNPTFPIQNITREETTYDSHLLACYDTEIQQQTENSLL